MLNFFKRKIKIENIGALEKGKTYLFKVDEMPREALHRVTEELGRALKKAEAFGIVYSGNIEVIIPKQEGDKNEVKNS
jgi:hypothetical protein